MSDSEQKLRQAMMRIAEVAQAAGFSSFRRATETPFNLVLEGRP